MRKAGGVIAIIAGIFGVMAAIVTLFVGGVGSAFHANNAGMVVGLGWGGVLFSFSTIVLGALCIAVQSPIVGLLLIACSICGIVLGGTFVAVFMALALIGGLLASFGRGSQQGSSPPSTSIGAHSTASQGSDLDQVIDRYVQKAGQTSSSDRTIPLGSRAPTAGFGNAARFEF